MFRRHLLFAIFAVVFLPVLAIGQQIDRPELKKSKMGFVQVKGNQFVIENGEPITFKGLAISCPDKVEADGHWNRKHFETIKSWGANLVRIPIHPASLRKTGMKKYLELLDQAVTWCGELEMYVIIDWHSIGNLREARFEADQYKTTLRETMQFWKEISKHFAGNPTVAFYEIFNEPSTGFGKYGNCTWQQWKTMVERTVDIIYSNDKKVIPLVAGFDWGYDLREVKKNPIGRTGIAYVAHPYPGKCKPPREPHWEEHFGFLSSQYPVIVTEMGFYLKGQYDNMVDDGTFRDAIVKYLDKKGISWCVWIFDPDWDPSLIESYDYQPTHPGAFFKKAMLGH